MTMKTKTFAVAGLLLAGSALWQVARSADTPTAQDPKTEPKTDPKTDTKGQTRVYDFKMKSLAGQDVDLSKYKGKVLLLVNTASKCGYTKQYAGLEQLHEKYGAQGLAVLGFPANDFGAQEPGTNEEIGAFCQKNYGVSFDMFGKIAVKGAEKAPLYRYLTEESPFKGEIGWNFEKFLVSKDGQIIARYKSAVTPDSAELTRAIEAELAKTP